MPFPLADIAIWLYGFTGKLWFGGIAISYAKKNAAAL
jgi:hypothetical protein